MYNKISVTYYFMYFLLILHVFTTILIYSNNNLYQFYLRYLPNYSKFREQHKSVIPIFF